eukprot:m.226920 g.226920  ORF g.226920 m.226920 type:complete len:80 (-) comp15967_c0_seq6:18-257(-)
MDKPGKKQLGPKDGITQFPGFNSTNTKLTTTATPKVDLSTTKATLLKAEQELEQVLQEEKRYMQYRSFQSKDRDYFSQW